MKFEPRDTTSKSIKNTQKPVETPAIIKLQASQ